jgi:hypothetical protein
MLTVPIITTNPALAMGIASKALSWLEKVLLELDALEVDADIHVDRVFQIGCPVDIKIVDGSGNTIGSLISHKEKKALSEIGVITLGDGESSYIVIPKGVINSITITGKDEGNMTIGYACIDEEGSILAEGMVADIPVHKGEKFTLNNQNSDDDMPLVVSSTGMVYVAGESDKLLLLPADLTSIEDEAFAGLEVEKVVIPASCEYVGHRAFANCKSLKIVQFIDGDNVDVEEDFLKGSPNARIVAPEGSYMAAW